MNFYSIFCLYVGRKFLLWFLTVFALLTVIILLVDFVELSRRTSSKSDVSVGLVLVMLFFKTPFFLEKLVPFATLFSAIFTFNSLNRHNEFIVARAAGISVWQILLPVLICAFCIGGIKATIFNPVAASMLVKYEKLKDKHIYTRSAFLQVFSDGVWLRQETGAVSYIMHGRRYSVENYEMQDVIVFLTQDGDRFAGRVDAPIARWKPGYWELVEPRLNGLEPGRSPFHNGNRLPTTLTPEYIQSSAASVDAVSFWALPDMIRTLEQAGFPTRRFRLRWHSQLANPILLCALVFLAAIFSFRPPRKGGAILAMASATAIGFVVYLLMNLINTLAISAQIPVILAAWSSVWAGLLLGITVLFYIEDG